MLGPLVSDPEISSLFSDDAAIRAMLAFEAALAQAQERLEVIPAGSASRISAAAASLKPDRKLLGEGAVSAGHPVAALVGQLREAVGPAADYVHLGATAQDVMDTALTMRLTTALDRFDSRLKELVELLAAHARDHRNTVMPGRTRSQHAVPVSFGLKAAGWLLPLVRNRKRLSELRPRALTVQLGGAAGTLGVLAPKGVAVMEEVARELKLSIPPAPWHSQRDGLAEIASWLSLVTSSLAKMGQDLTLLAQSEIGEASDGSHGHSSAMPHKSNPVRSEVLVTIGRANAGLLASMHQAAIHEHERSGSAWTLEWLTLPQMAVLTGASLRLARAVAESLDPDPKSMLLNVERSHGLLLAEFAAFALSKHYSLPEARRIVSDASRRAFETDQQLLEILAAETQADIDWDALANPATWLGSTPDFIARALRAAASGRE